MCYAPCGAVYAPPSIDHSDLAAYEFAMKSFGDLPQSEVDILISRAYREFSAWREHPAGNELKDKLTRHIDLLNELARDRPKDARRIRGLAGRMEKFRLEVERS